MKRCVVGYSGGKELNPTYTNIKDHTEALLVEFDPNEVTYEDLCLDWSRMHNPTYDEKQCQYRSAVWYLNNEQKEIVEEVVGGMKAATSCPIYTSTEKVTRFYKAEEYHQNFLTKSKNGMW